MKTLLLLLLVLTPTCFAGQLYKLNVGAQWKYQIDDDKTQTLTNAIIGTKTIKGKQWYKLKEYGDIFWISNTRDGQVEAINFFNEEPKEQDTPEEVLIFKHPATVGDTWNNEYSPTTYEGVQTLTVPAGTFKCHTYNIDMGNGNYSKSCIALDIGVIYNETVINGGTKSVSRLLEYSFKK